MPWKFETDIFESEPPIFRGDEAPPPAKLDHKELSCVNCPLNLTSHSGKLPFIGDGAKGVLILASKPYRDEDMSGELGHGKEFNFLSDTLDSMGINLKKDCYYMTAVSCYPARKREATLHEVSCCRSRVMSVINKLKPNSIIMLGQEAFNSIIYPKLTGRLTGTGWEKFCGDKIPDQDMLTWLIPTWDVSTLLETKDYDDGGTSKPLYERDVAWYRLWKQHLYSAFNTNQIVKNNYANDCFTTTDVEQAKDWLIDALHWPVVSFDYETTGIKPYRKGHEIICASISNGLFSFAFPFFHDEQFRFLWKKLMESNIGKISHNAQFEWTWTRQLCGYWPKNLLWDTMLGQHSFHNKKPTGLKYVTYVQTGDIGYDDGIDFYIKSLPEEKEKYGTNAFNRMKQAPIKETLLYCALDSLYTYKIYEKQKGALTPFQIEGLNFFHESAVTLAKASFEGFKVDEEAFNKAKTDSITYLAQLKADVLAQPEIKQWDGTEEINIDSPEHMRHLFFDILKYKKTSATSTGLASVDKIFLEKSNTSFSRKLKAYRETGKVINTYISDYERETIDGYVHPNFSLNTVDTFRSSCREPNVQNIPKRNKAVKKLLRSFIVAPKDAYIVEYDYKTLELGINGCHSKDRSMAKYVTDPDADYHRDSAMNCYILTREEVTPEYRTAIKGLWGFSCLYGNYYKNMARDLWEYAEEHPELLQHLKEHGIKTYEAYELQTKEAERVFWEERFPEHDTWRKEQWKYYQKHGIIRSHTGFIMQGPMKRNNTFNAGPQGDGYHVLQWTMNKVTEFCEKKKLRSRPIGEIHDAMVSIVYPEEQDIFDYAVWLYGTVKVREHWPWISLPLTLEKERSELGGTWAEMKNCGALKGDA